MNRRMSNLRERQLGTGLIELGLLVPVILIIILATVDFGRLIYMRQVLTDLTREAGNLVSRGASPDEAFTATVLADDPFDVDATGSMIVSLVRRRADDDAQPWIFEQDSSGTLTEHSSKVGSLGGPASIPNIESLDEGTTVMAVEMFHVFEPVFRLEGLGLNLYPEAVYDVAFF